MLERLILNILTNIKYMILTKLATWLDMILSKLATWLEDELLTQVLSLLSCSVLSTPPASTQASLSVAPASPLLQVISSASRDLPCHLL